MTEKSRKPEDTPFKQQKLKAWQPILTPNWVIGTFAVIGLIFIPIGIVLHLESENVVEYSIQYDGEGANTSSNIQNSCILNSEADGNTFDTASHGCTLTFEVKEDMKAPVYVYYQLDNFYQNHRRYVQSRSDTQLRGERPSSLSDCDPMPTTTGVSKFNSTADEALSTDTTVRYDLNPCGLIANSLFNDIIWVDGLQLADGTSLNSTDDYQGTDVLNLMDQTGIAWQSDISTKFKNFPESERLDSELYLWQNPNYRFIIPSYVGQPPIAGKTAWTKPAEAFGVKDEHFIVWMRTAGLPNFRKLYGRINTDLKAGMKISFLISSNFVVKTFDGKKYLVISTTSWFGGRNPFLGIAYITVGSLCMVLAILFFAKHKISPRKLGDTRYLVWKNNQ